jgi:hypothetical protein
MIDWTNAGDVEELKKLFFMTSPIIAHSTSSKKRYISEIKKIASANKIIVFIAVGIVVLSIGTLIFNTILEGRTLKLEQRNNQTEYNNRQYKIQEKEIQDQKKFIADQNKLEAARILKERKQVINNRLLEIKNLLTLASLNVEKSYNELKAVQGFQLFRTNNERKNHINSIENNIQFWHNEIEQLESESSMLSLELEKIH